MKQILNWFLGEKSKKIAQDFPHVESPLSGAANKTRYKVDTPEHTLIEKMPCAVVLEIGKISKTDHYSKHLLIIGTHVSKF